MKKIIFHQPSKLVFGEGSLDHFVDDYLSLGYRRLYVLTIEAVLPLLQEAIDKLKGSGVEISWNTSIQNEPTFSEFENILDQAKSFNADSVVGIGGGSVMDMAKLVAAQLNSHQQTNEIIGNGLIKGRDVYMACLPTTSGTGSEVSPNAIFLDETDGGKKGVISPFLVPDAAYVDPKLSEGVPPAVTAATGIDALTHCLEAYTNKFAHPMVDVFALEGIKLIAANLKRACDCGSDTEARANVALGSLYGGMCLGPVNTAAVHALAYPLGSMFKVSHGLSNALLLPYVMECNLEYALEKYASIAIALGAQKMSTLKETAEKGVEILKDLMKNCGVPQKLSDINVPDSALEKMTDEALKVERLLKNNPRELQRADILEIYQKAF